MCGMNFKLGAYLFYIALRRGLFGTSFLVSLESRWFTLSLCIHIIFSSLNSEVLDLVNMQISCGSPRFMMYFGVFGWKGMLEYLKIPLRS